MSKKAKIYLLKEEEIERFDLLLTALDQAYWSLMQQRSIIVPQLEAKNKITRQEEAFYQLHLDPNAHIDSTDNS